MKKLLFLENILLLIAYYRKNNNNNYVSIKHFALYIN